MEIRVSDMARNRIVELALENGVEPVVRIFVESAACSGARFGIAFDDPRQNDVLTEIDGIEFVTDSEYVPKYSDGINIEYVISPKEGFVITSITPVKKNCGSEGGGCGGCGGHKH